VASLQTNDHEVEQSAQDLRPDATELVLQGLVGLALFFRNRVERQKDRAIGEVGSVDEILNTVENRRTLCIKKLLLIVGVELAVVALRCVVPTGTCSRQPGLEVGLARSIYTGSRGSLCSSARRNGRRL
jgi:hypothetical protein